MPRSFYRCVVCDFEGDSHSEVEKHEKLDCGAKVSLKLEIAKVGVREYLARLKSESARDRHPVEARIILALTDAMKEAES